MPNEAGPTTGLKSATEFVARETGGPGDDTHRAATAFESSGRGPLRCSSILHHRFSPSSHKRSGAVGVVIGASQMAAVAQFRIGSLTALQEGALPPRQHQPMATEGPPSFSAKRTQRDTSTTGTHFPSSAALSCPQRKGRPRWSIVTWKTLSVYAEAMQSPSPPVLCHEVGQGSSLDSARLDFPRTPG